MIVFLLCGEGRLKRWAPKNGEQIVPQKNASQTIQLLVDKVPISRRSAPTLRENWV
jgi:hypothetical protein